MALSSDCWIFGDSLNTCAIPGPATRGHPPDSAHACIPNAQHWSVQQGQQRTFRYEDQALDRSLALVRADHNDRVVSPTGYEVVEILGRIFDEPARQNVLPSIRHGSSIGNDPRVAEEDCWRFNMFSGTWPERPSGNGAPDRNVCQSVVKLPYHLAPLPCY